MIEASQLIDKLALIYLRSGEILMTLSEGKAVYYIPGGKREAGESDETALRREVREELQVELVDGSIELYGVFEAQAHGKPEGTIVRMTCYTAEIDGEAVAGAEIQDLAWYTYAQREMVGPVDQLIFDDLHAKGLLS